MKNALLLILIAQCTARGFAQVSPGNLTTEATPFLCQPGVVNKAPGKGASFTYSFNPDFQMRPPDAERASKVSRSERFDTKLKVPLINATKFKMLAGFQYTLERYHFDDIVPENYPLFKRLNETQLKTAGVALYGLIPVNHQFYTSFRLSASWNGDYAKFISLDNRYGIYRAAGMFGYKKSKYLEYGGGLLFTKNFRRTSVLPFGFYNQTFDEHWGIEVSLPVSIKGRYNFSERSLVMFGTEYSSQNYALAVKEPSMNPFEPQPEKAPYYYRRATLDLVGSFYRQLTSWVWVEAKGGYAFQLNSEARDIPEKQNYDLKPSGSLVGMMSIFISPPRIGRGE